eukprot:TRINITY_DN68119_c0_g1_i1.p1 TRINITY_DN68119_c0_g1~~TRINITY_DN68119_c0_g1_i1.p1  ORF type:complete len:134 (-),score=22.77 TRINITY_DN68119_c0_g1_i1:193-594(-)
MACTGKYKLAKSENFEDFMKALGVGMVTRKLGNKTSPTITVTEEGGEYTFKQESLVKTSEIKFKIGEEFEESTADGRKVLSKMTLTAPNVMVHEMKGTNGGKDSTCIREFLGHEMIATCTVDDIETVRTYSAV